MTKPIAEDYGWNGSHWEYSGCEGEFQHALDLFYRDNPPPWPMGVYAPTEVSKEQMERIIATRKPFGGFYCVADGQVLSCDNSTGDAWVEAFPSKPEAVARLVNRHRTGYTETEENCKECEAKALLLACRTARIAYYRAEHGTPERALAIGRTQEAERAADEFLEHCRGCVRPGEVREDSELRRVVEWAHGIANSLSNNTSFSEQERQMFSVVRDGIISRVRGQWLAPGEMRAEGAEYWRGLAKEMEAQLIAAQERIGQLEFEREEVRKMRTIQKTFFRSPQGSAARNTALEDSRRLERWVDAALEPAKPTAATLFG